jgi:hypothetical protein
MIRRLASLLALGALAACSEAPAPPPAAPPAPPKADLQRAQEAMQDLGATLRGALRARMQQDGPLGAIDFCRLQAPQIAAEVSAKHGIAVGRTALRLRNPANAPRDWQLPVLEDFQARFEAGTPAGDLAMAMTDGLPDGVALRAMRGIPTEPACQLCHGVVLAPTIAEAIAGRYPDDRATGFAIGDLRGAIWAEVPATDSTTTKETP